MVFGKSEGFFVFPLRVPDDMMIIIASVVMTGVSQLVINCSTQITSSGPQDQFWVV